MRTIPLWQDQAPMEEQLGMDPLPQTTDVAIVGGGYTGLQSARNLRDAGLDCAVLEENEIGFGASSRNGGKALVGLKHDASTVARQFGNEIAEGLWRSSLEGINRIEEISLEEGIDCEYSRTGSVYLACRKKHFESMQKESEWLDQHYNYKRVDVPKDELHSEIGTSVYHGGTVDPLSAGIHPAKWVRGLAKTAKLRSATLCSNTRVIQITRLKNGFQVKTNRGNLISREVLVATNGYTEGLNKSISRRVVPVGSYIIATEPADPSLVKQLSPKARMFYDSNWFLKYFRFTTDGRMLFGGRTTISTGQDLKKSAALLQKDMCEMFPQLASLAVTHSWNGQLGVTFDALPHIGKVDGIHYALGYGGHGVALSIVLADHVSELIAGKRQHSLFSEISHPTYWFYRNKPWFRPFLGLGLRILDKIG